MLKSYGIFRYFFGLRLVKFIDWHTLYSTQRVIETNGSNPYFFFGLVTTGILRFDFLKEKRDSNLRTGQLVI